MAVDMFIKIGDIDGESVDAKHAKEIDVLAWSWGMSPSGTTHTAGGGGAVVDEDGLREVVGEEVELAGRGADRRMSGHRAFEAAVDKVFAHPM